MAPKLLLLALRNMRRQLRRTILTALTFAVAVFLYTVLVAVPVSMDRIAADAAKGLRLIVIAHNSYHLPAKYCGSIKKMPHVIACVPEIQFTAMYRDPRDSVMAIGITEDIFSLVGSNEFQVPPEMRKKIFADRRGASVGTVLMREHGWKIGQQITLRDPGNPQMTLTLVPMLELADPAHVARAVLQPQALRRSGEERLRCRYSGPCFVSGGQGRPRREHGSGDR